MEKIIRSNDFIKERCVSFETAKILKPIYNKICDLAWYQFERIKPEYENKYGKYYPYEIMNEFPDKFDKVVESVYGLHQFISRNNDEYPNLYTAPNIFDVILFFIETYNIHISEYYDNGKWYWCYTILDDYNTLIGEDSEYYVNSDIGYDTIIEALDKGIFEVAKHCIPCK